MSSNPPWNSFGIAIVVIVVVGLALGGGYFYGRDGNRGDGNDIRIDRPDGPRKR